MSHQKNGFEKGHSDAYMKNLKRWEKDYQLQELERLHLFDEYIEMSNFDLPQCGNSRFFLQHCA